jgi:hypothetical protein
MGFPYPPWGGWGFTYGAFDRYAGESEDTREKIFFDATVQTALTARLASLPLEASPTAIDYAGREAVHAAGAAVEARRRWWEEDRKRKSEERARLYQEEQERAREREAEHQLRMAEAKKQDQEEARREGPDLYTLQSYIRDRSIVDSLFRVVSKGWKSRYTEIKKYIEDNPGWPEGVRTEERRAEYRNQVLNALKAHGWQPPPPEVPSGG